MLGYDATQDLARYRTDPHYRVWFSTRRQRLVVIEVQDFDYDSYSPDGFVDYVAYDTVQDAQLGRALILAVVNAVAAVA